MTNTDIQQAIESARAWLSTQVSTSTTPSYELRDATVFYIKKLQEIQIARAGLLNSPNILRSKTHE